jgi:hypothetical protein
VGDVCRQAVVSFLLVLALSAFCVPQPRLLADVGPKPSMTFQVVFEMGEPLEIVGGQQMQCEETDCSDARPLEELGPQSFRCDGDSCSSMAYGYTTYNRLVLTFSDGVTRRSNVFTSGVMNSRYRVTVREDSLEVRRIGGGRAVQPLLWVLLGRIGGTGVALVFAVALLVITGWSVFSALRRRDALDMPTALLLAAWIVSVPLLDFGTAFSLAPLVTLVVEGLVVLAYAAATRQPVSRWLTQVLLVNMISQPALWLVLISRGPTLPYLPTLAAAEPLIWLLEAGLLYLLQGRRLAFLRVLLVSLALNGASLVVGLFIGV